MNGSLWRAGACASLVLIAVTIAAGSTASANSKTSATDSTSVRITGKVARPLVVSDGELQALPRKRVTVTGDKGTQVTYDGVLVSDLLQRAGVPLDKGLRGVQMRLYVIVEGADGYQVVFALPEFDGGFTDRVTILADRQDGKALPSPEGPFRLIVEGEKRRARWVREVSSLDVEQAR